jgi:hypothetical protein
VAQKIALEEEKKFRTQINGKCNDVNSASENK